MSSGSMTNSYVKKRFGIADRIKIGRKAYATDLEEHYILGVTTALELLLNKDAKGDIQTKDDLLAEIHLEVVENWNKFHRINPKYTQRIELQDVLNRIYGNKQ